MRRREVAREIRTAARTWLERANEEGALSTLAAIYRSDAADLMKIAHLVDEGKIQRARDEANFDTIVRDQLPNSFFDLLKKHDVNW